MPAYRTSPPVQKKESVRLLIESTLEFWAIQDDTVKTSEVLIEDFYRRHRDTLKFSFFAKVSYLAIAQAVCMYPKINK